MNAQRQGFLVEGAPSRNQTFLPKLILGVITAVAVSYVLRSVADGVPWPDVILVAVTGALLTGSLPVYFLVRERRRRKRTAQA